MSGEIDDLRGEIERMLNGEEAGDNLFIKLTILKHYDHPLFMDTMYRAFTANSGKVIQSTANPLARINAMAEMIEHFKGREEYEKCGELLKIQQEIEKDEGD
jgi:hypothetical protein